YVIDATLAGLDEFQERDSGWALSRILNLIVNVNKCNPMHAGCWFEIPQWIKVKKAVINVHSYDNACFAWAVISALYPALRNVDRCGSYPYYATVLNLEGIEFPMTLRQISRFERLNDISVNVFTTWRKGRNDEIVPLQLTNDKDRHVNLLYLSDSRNNSNGGHFACIKNLSRLLGSQLNRSKNMKYICDRCLHYFHSREKLSAHSVDCGKMNDCVIVLPNDDDKWLFFRDHSRKERLPFVVYADLECVLEKEKIDNDNVKRYTYQHHRAFSVGYYLCSPYDEIGPGYRFRRGEDCVSWFVNELNVIAHCAKEILMTNVTMAELTLDETRNFWSATSCHICERPFKSEDGQRVRNHCHLTGRYRGPAHPRCNLNYRDSYVIPVFFHSLSGYDAHFIIKDIANSFEGRIDLLPLTKELYILFTKYVREGVNWGNCAKLRFVDSFKFLSTSLEKLASYLDKDKLKIMRSEFSELSESDFDLLTRKGVFPYEYVDGFDKLLVTELPPREDFYSSLTGETASESDYEHARNVWGCFRVRNLGEYSDLYLKTDVLLLADIFENFRDTCIDTYGLDPAHYYTLPGYTWDAMLKYTGVRFELLTDIDMVMFVERGIRGGLSQCPNRYARANNKYMRSHDSSQPSTYLMYFDVNNLYGWAMCEPLPYADFQWVDDAESLDVMSVKLDSAIGYILEVDLAYPHKFHDAHADLPFCPTRDKSPGKRCDKLLATLRDKSRYVLHYRNLQQCVRYGLCVTKIHRALRFAQFPWLRGYIELNTGFRARASNDFEKEMYKLMNNAVFGKTMENNLIAVELRRLEVRLYKPIYVGMCILEISKTRVYDFHYDYMVPLHRERCKIMYTDTDSLIYFLECDDAYEDMKRDIARFDTSEYPKDNKYRMPRVNKKIPGLMKDENDGAVMTEFVGLRSKMYALRVEEKSDTKKIKGIKRNVVARTITFDDYVCCLNDAIGQFRRQSCIRSTAHEVHTVSELKLALSPYDDKRYVVPDS
ncbi:uncharacterized protein LOC112454272, partial [Temnothorax curvispinosus]|uniref:DNA-directed DNA polymerase n=1 Tax=Temnothorax curvispinosus TaxID=300111 RepID=A0A6J1PPT4_9HYME